MTRPILILSGSAIKSDSTKERLRNLFDLIEIPAIRDTFYSPNERYLLWCGLDSRISRKSFQQNSYPEFIVTSSTGVSHIEIDLLELLGDKIIKLEGSDEGLNLVSSTSELSWSLFLYLHTNLSKLRIEVLEGTWDRSNHYRNQISNLSIGVVGFGRLGKITARYVRAFGATLKVWDTNYRELEIAQNLYPNSPATSLQNLLENSDVVFLHANEQIDRTAILNRSILVSTKTRFGLINTARGSLVDENAIIDALERGQIHFYGTDVLQNEYGDWRTSPILEIAKKSDKVLVTPHVGGATFQAAHQIEDILIEKLLRRIDK